MSEIIHIQLWAASSLPSYIIIYYMHISLASKIVVVSRVRVNGGLGS